MGLQGVPELRQKKGSLQVWVGRNGEPRLWPTSPAWIQKAREQWPEAQEEDSKPGGKVPE